MLFRGRGIQADKFECLNERVRITVCWWQPSVLVFKDHHIPAIELVFRINQEVHKNTVIDLQCLFHRAGRNQKGPKEEGSNHKGDNDRNRDNDQYFAKSAENTPRAFSRSLIWS